MDDILKPGDLIVCKVRESAIILASESDYDEKKIFEIIALNYQGWYLYIPSYIVIKGSSLITTKNFKSLGIDPKFLGEETVFITNACIVKVEKYLVGIKCKKCQEYFEFAVPNQDDGTLLCWYCKTYPFYK